MNDWSAKFIGILPYSYREDLFDVKVYFDRVLNDNVDYRVPVADRVDSRMGTSILIPFTVDFNIEYSNYYYTYDEVAAYIGGVFAFSLPFIWVLMPIAIMWYLYRLSKILKERHELQYNG